MNNTNNYSDNYSDNYDYQNSLTRIGDIEGNYPFNNSIGEQGSVYGAEFKPIDNIHTPYYESMIVEPDIKPWNPNALWHEQFSMNNLKAKNQEPVQTYRELKLSAIPTNEHEIFEQDDEHYGFKEMEQINDNNDNSKEKEKDVEKDVEKEIDIEVDDEEELNNENDLKYNSDEFNPKIDFIKFIIFLSFLLIILSNIGNK